MLSMSAGVEKKVDWLKTPGIAHTSMRQLREMGTYNRGRRAVMIGFGDYPRDQKIKENHDRLMNNLKDRYEGIHTEKIVDVKEEEEKENLEPVKKEADFGTKSSFCDKVYKPVPKRTDAVPTLPPPTPQPPQRFSYQHNQHNNRKEYSKQFVHQPNGAEKNNSEFRGTGSSLNRAETKEAKMDNSKIMPLVPERGGKQPDAPRFIEGSKKKKNVEDLLGTIEEEHTGEQQPQFGSSKNLPLSNAVNYAHMQHRQPVPPIQSNVIPPSNAVNPMQYHPFNPINVVPSSNAMMDDFMVSCKSPSDVPHFGVWKAESPKSTLSGGTPNEDQIMEESFDDSPTKEENKNIHPSPFKEEKQPHTIPHQIPQIPQIRKVRSHLASFIVLSNDDAKVSAKCSNQTVEEKVRRYDREPTAAGKRYLRTQDRMENTERHQLHTQIKFDKHRCKKWVARSQSNTLTSSDEESSEFGRRRRRRYSDPPDDEYSAYPNLLIDNDPLLPRMEKAEITFNNFHQWMRYDMKWALADSLRVATPEKDTSILVRVLDVGGRRVTIAPSVMLKVMEDMAKSFVVKDRRRIDSNLNQETMVIVEQDSDTIGESEYRRGWMFNGDAVEVEVLLMDERRIVTVPRNKLYICPMPVMTWAPPLCVAAEFDREPTEHEQELLQCGCLAQCIVESEENENGGEGNILKLRLVKINTDNIRLDELFCDEKCAGACEHYRG